MASFALTLAATATQAADYARERAASETDSVPRWLRTGLVVSTPEQREKIPEVAPPSLGRGTLPPAVDLSRWFPKPRSQGEQGTCGSFALASYRTYLLARHNRSDPDREEVRSSPAFIFSQIGDLKKCQGSSLEEGMQLLKASGVVSEKDYPYIDSKLGCLRPAPTADLMAKARPWRTTGWGRVELREPHNANDLKVFLANQEPVVFAMNIGSLFDKLGKGVMSQTDTEGIRGSHAMVLAGYDDKRRAFKILNSWGESWGDKGFGWIDYEIFMKEWQYGYIASDRIALAPTLLGAVRDDFVRAASGKQIKINVLENDEYDRANPPRVYLAKTPQHGKAKVIGSQIVYQSEAGYIGKDKVYYALVDSSNKRGAAMAEVTVEKAEEGGPYDKLESTSGVKIRFPTAGIIAAAELKLKFVEQHLEVQIDSLELVNKQNNPIIQAIMQGKPYQLCVAVDSSTLGIERKKHCGITRHKGNANPSESFSLPLMLSVAQLAQAGDLNLWLILQAQTVKTVSGAGEQLGLLLRSAH